MGPASLRGPAAQENTFFCTIFKKCMSTLGLHIFFPRNDLRVCVTRYSTLKRVIGVICCLRLKAHCDFLSLWRFVTLMNAMGMYGSARTEVTDSDSDKLFRGVGNSSATKHVHAVWACMWVRALWLFVTALSLLLSLSQLLRDLLHLLILEIGRASCRERV